MSKPNKTSESEDLDLYDDKVQQGIAWTLRQVGHAVGLTQWDAGDGSETVEGDVGAEIHTILVDAGLRCPETCEMATLATPAKLARLRAALDGAIEADDGLCRATAAEAQLDRLVDYLAGPVNGVRLGRKEAVDTVIVNLANLIKRVAAEGPPDGKTAGTVQ